MEDNPVMHAQHALFPSLDDMLAPEALSVLVGQQITDVRRLPFSAETTSASGNCFLTVETNGGQGPRYIVKRVSLAWDWIMHASGDCQAREVRVWQLGLLDWLPDATLHTVVACAQDGDGWAILMRDVSAALFGYTDRPFRVAEVETILDAMAALHARFWQEPCLDNPALGLCPAQRLYTCLGPRVGYGPEPQPAEIAAADTGTEPSLNVRSRRLIGDGWRLLEAAVEPDVAGVVRALLEDPQPLCDALARYPWTLVHGDMRAANLGIDRDRLTRLVVIDWQFASRMPPAVDLAWFIGSCFVHLPITVEAAIRHYRQRLAYHLGDRFSEERWQPQLELSLLGQFLRHAWFDLYNSVRGETEAERAFRRSKLALLSAWVRGGVQWL
jgi:hypothetical protein